MKLLELLKQTLTLEGEKKDKKLMLLFIPQSVLLLFVP